MRSGWLKNLLGHVGSLTNGFMIGSFLTKSARSPLSMLLDRLLASANASIISAFIRLQFETRRVAWGEACSRFVGIDEIADTKIE